MDGENEVRRELNEMSTCWSELRDAFRPDIATERARRACERILVRYRDAIIRYVRATLRSQDAAEEVYQNFSLRFVKGDFRHANPDRGRFRDYLKSALFHLVQDYRRQMSKLPRPLTPAMGEPSVDASPSAEDDSRFMTCWRDQLFHRAMASLEEHERYSHRPLASVLRLRIDHPDWHYDQFADHFSARLGRPIKVESIRKIIMEARTRFRESLVREVYQTLDAPSLAEVEEELIDLGLHEVCRPVLRRRRDPRPNPAPIGS